MLAGLLSSSNAQAQDIIKSPGNHPQGPELEPHLTLSPFRHGSEVGLGFRATFQIGRNNFISSINNSVGVGVGLDWVPLCGGSCNAGHLLVPIVMQWSFYLARSFSLFAEPGLLADLDGAFAPNLMLQIGGRWHFKDTTAFTFRIGWPYVSLGLSFL